jgi:hypothetical protein
MRLRMHEGARIIAIIVFIDVHIGLPGDQEILFEQLLVFILDRKKEDLVGTVPDGAVISIFCDVMNRKAGHRDVCLGV